MTAPYAEETLTLSDGRLLAWAEWGDPRGTPLVFMHPSPGSRLLCPDAAATTAAGVRLITVDRPGYGRSDPVPDPNLVGFAWDLERLLDHLWLGEIGVVGWSTGGQYAAACAASLAERVSAVALVATPAPDHLVEWLTPAYRQVAELARVDPRRALAVAHQLTASSADGPEGGGHGDVTLFDLDSRVHPDVEPQFMKMWQEAFRPGTGGLAADLVAVSRPWEFAATQVRAPVDLFYGRDDPLIDPGHGRWWARALPRARLRIHSGNGPSLPFVAWTDMLRAMTTPW